MTQREPLDEQQLLAVLEEQTAAARDYYNAEIADEQADAIKFYEAEPFGDEIDGQSQIVVPDVRDAVDHMTVQVIKPFVSGDRVVEFEAKSGEDAQYADEATEAVARAFMRGQDGFRVVHDWVKAGLKEKFCALKSTAAIEAKLVTERFVIDGDQLALLDDVTAATAVEASDPDGQPMYQVTRRVQKMVPRFTDYTLPSEEYRFSARARSEDDADFQEHVCRKTRSDLVEMGFDVEQVYDLPIDAGEIEGDERSVERDRNWLETTSNASMQEVTLHESYIRIDADGDGVAELLQVFRVGSHILRVASGELAISVVNEQPFTVFTPFPEPHRLIGSGLADKAMLSQRVRSVIARQLLNGMYRDNVPRFWVPDESCTDDTLDDLLETVGPVRGKGAAPQQLGGNFDVSKSLGVLEFFSRERDVSTGITDINRGVAPDALNNTATAARIQDDRSAETAEFLCRVFGEAFARACVKKYRLLKEIGEPFDLKIDGEYRRVDPTLWPDDVDVLVRVGLGTGNKDHRLQLRMSLLGVQKEALAMGMASPENLFNNVAAIVKDAGLGQPDDYFVNPANAQPPQQPPDPAMVEAQAKVVVEQQKLAIERQKAEHQMAMDERRLDWEMQLAEAKMRTEAQLALMKQDAGMETNRPGGSLAA